MTARAVLLVPILAFAAHAQNPRERGLRLFHQGDPVSAARAFEEAARRSPSDADAYLNAAVLYRELGRPEKALPLFVSASRLRPDDPDIQAARGWATLRAGQPEAAERAFSRALALDPENPQALLGRGRLSLDAGEMDEALGTLRQLARIKPEFTLADVYLARAYEARKDWKDAAAAYQRAYETDPTYSEVRLAMGPLYARLHRFNLAWMQYSKVLDLDPANRAARREKSRLSRLITRKPSQLRPPKRIRRTLASPWAAESEAMPKVRIALGTTSLGEPLPRKAFAFFCSGAFWVLDSGSGKRLLTGPGGQVFVLRKARARKGFELVDSRQRRLLRFARALLIRPESARGRSLTFRGLQLASGTAWASLGDRQLKGSVEVRPEGRDGLYLVNVLGLEDYLYGVINGEMPSDYPAEALKAQAIIARNHALYTKTVLKPHRKHGYDLCDGQHCQVYGGVGGESRAGRQAVDETRGLVLSWRGRLAQTPYSANCGGHTQGSGELQGWGEFPYLRGSPDSRDGAAPAGPWELDRWLKTAPQAYCNVPDYMLPSAFRWSRVIDARALEARLKRRGQLGRLKDVLVLRRSRAGNVNALAFVGTLGRLELHKENEIRRIMGLAAIRSTLFEFELERGPDRLPRELFLYGAGWGHGVGLCQCGAAGRAEAGQTAEAILAHYYPGTTIKDLDY